MNAPDWIKELELLTLRFPEYGVGVDLSALTESEQWGIYCFLRRMAGELNGAR